MSSTVFVRQVGPPTVVGRRRWPGVLAAAVVVVVSVLVLYDPPSTGETYDPASRAEDGLAVGVDVLDELGVEVQVADRLPDADDVDAVLAPPLGWQDAELRGLAEQGVRVVAVVPPTPDSTPVDTTVGGLGLVTREVDCPLLADVTMLRSPTWRSWQVPVGELPDDARRCLVDGDMAWATELPVGDGTLVALGSMAPLVNARTLEADTTVAIVRLLEVAPGDRVVALTAPDVDLGGPQLLDLVDRRWFDAAWLTLLALVLVAVARGRRHGLPVTEQLPVRVPSGELARATGDLRHRVGADAAAIEELRSRTLTMVGGRLGLGPAPDPVEVVEAMRAAGIGLRDDDAYALVHPPGATTDGEVLQSTAARFVRVRRAVVGADAGPGPPQSGDGAAFRDSPTADTPTTGTPASTPDTDADARPDETEQP